MKYLDCPAAESLRHIQPVLDLLHGPGGRVGWCEKGTETPVNVIQQFIDKLNIGQSMRVRANMDEDTSKCEVCRVNKDLLDDEDWEDPKKAGKDLFESLSEILV